LAITTPISVITMLISVITMGRYAQAQRHAHDDPHDLLGRQATSP